MDENNGVDSRRGKYLQETRTERSSYTPARMRFDCSDTYETVREQDELDRVKDWPNAQDVELEWDDPSREADEPGWFQREVERVAREKREKVKRVREEELLNATAKRSGRTRGREGKSSENR